MKRKTVTGNNPERSVGSVCRDTCRKALMQISRAKEAIRAEWSQTLEAQQHALKLALNEAEALARQTVYPHLVFPSLAFEKVQAVATWNARQKRMLAADSHLRLHR
jgi:hypothetical protein